MHIIIVSKVNFDNMTKVFTLLSVRYCMVINSKRVSSFLVPMFVINNHTVRCVGIVSCVKHIAILGTKICEVS